MKILRILLCGVMFWASDLAFARETSGEYTQIPPEQVPPAAKEVSFSKTAAEQRTEHTGRIEQMQAGFAQKRRDDTMAFREKLKNMDPDERPAAIRAQNSIFNEEKLALNERINRANMDFLARRLDEDARLSREDKQAVLDAYENDYLSTQSFSEAHHTRDLMELEQIAATPGIPVDEILKRYEEYAKKDRKPPAAAPRERNRLKNIFRGRGQR